jgi:hypothetical protein
LSLVALAKYSYSHHLGHIMKQQKYTLTLDNKGKTLYTTNDEDKIKETNTIKLQRRLAIISKKLNLCALVNYK